MAIILGQFLDTVTDPLGRPVPQASIAVLQGALADVDVTTQPGTPLATIFSDPDGLIPISQPFSTDGLGNYQFFAAAGVYVVQIYGSGINVQTVLEVLIGGGGGGGGGTGGGSRALVIESAQASISGTGAGIRFFTYVVPANTVTASSFLRVRWSCASSGVHGISFGVVWGAQSITLGPSVITTKTNGEVIVTSGTFGAPLDQILTGTTWPDGADTSGVELTSTQDATGLITLGLLFTVASPDTMTELQVIVEVVSIAGGGGSPSGGGGLISQSKILTTGSIAAGAVGVVAITWDAPFADTSYVFAVSILEPGATSGTASLRILSVINLTATGIQVLVVNDDAVNPHTGTVYALAG